MIIETERYIDANGYPSYSVNSRFEDEDFVTLNIQDDGEREYAKQKIIAFWKNPVMFGFDFKTTQSLANKTERPVFHTSPIVTCLDAWEADPGKKLMYDRLLSPMRTWISVLGLKVGKGFNSFFFDGGYNRGKPKRVFRMGNDGVYELSEVPAVAAHEPTRELPAETAVRRPRHWLLSTAKTLAHFGIKDYGGDHYDYDRDHYRTCSSDNVFSLFAEAFYSVVIPNALIARRGGAYVSYTDALSAILYVFHSNETRKEALKSVLDDGETETAWVEKNAKAKFELYVLGRKEDGSTIPYDNRYTLETYEEHQRNTGHSSARCKSEPKFGRKVKAVVDAFMRNREIGSWDYERVMREFGISRQTASKFFALLKERRKSWNDYDGAFF